MKHDKKSNLLMALVMLVLSLIIYNVALLVPPITKMEEATFWVAFGIGDFLILTEGVFATVYSARRGKLAKTILGLPTFRSIVYGYALSIVASVTLIVINAFVAVPTWVAALIEIIVFCLIFLKVALGIFAKDKIISTRERAEAKTSFFHEAIQRIEACKGSASDPKPIESLYEAIRYDDKVSCRASEDVEDKIFEQIDALEAAVKDDKQPEVVAACAELKKLFAHRSTLVKRNKANW